MALLNPDFREFVDCLNKFEVEYILVGGYAVVVRGHSRSTGDMDVWVNKTPDNLIRLHKAMNEFGLPVIAISAEAFLSDQVDVFSFGRPPFAIEIMTAVKGLDFESSFAAATWYDDEGLKIRVIHLNQLILAKKASGRYKDLDDLEHLPIQLPE